MASTPWSRSAPISSCNPGTSPATRTPAPSSVGPLCRIPCWPTIGSIRRPDADCRACVVELPPKIPHLPTTTPIDSSTEALHRKPPSRTHQQKHPPSRSAKIEPLLLPTTIRSTFTTSFPAPLCYSRDRSQPATACGQPLDRQHHRLHRLEAISIGATAWRRGSKLHQPRSNPVLRRPCGRPPRRLRIPLDSSPPLPIDLTGAVHFPSVSFLRPNLEAEHQPL